MSSNDFSFEFEPFPKIPRLKTRIIVTEKIDGTNGQVAIFGPYKEKGQMPFEGHPKLLDTIALRDEPGDPFQYFGLFAGSRKRYVTLGDDNFGFAQWVFTHGIELVAGLGPGRHFGEWWGSGIQRTYGLDHKRFSLFNTMRWRDDNPPPACCHTVPILADGEGLVIEDIMNSLKQGGSVAAPGFMDPEGIIYYHTGSREKGLFKCTFEHDKGKWSSE